MNINSSYFLGVSFSLFPVLYHFNFFLSDVCILLFFRNKIVSQTQQHANDKRSRTSDLRVSYKSPNWHYIFLLPMSKCNMGYSLSTCVLQH